jgi:hypothetical protein
MMSDDELQTENFRAGWHADALGLATQEADAAGLQGAEREDFIREREAYHYAERERVYKL